MVRSIGPLFKAAFVLGAAAIIFSMLNPEHSLLPGGNEAPVEMQVENHQQHVDNDIADGKPEVLGRADRYRMEADFEAGYQPPAGCSDRDKPLSEQQCAEHRAKTLADFESQWTRYKH